MASDETVLQTIAKTIPPMNPEGRKFVIIFLAGTVLLGLLADWLFWTGIVLTLWCAYFFRDPIRTVPQRAGLVVSPADGLVQKIASVIPPASLKLGEMPRTRVSIFLNVFDVHVNRIPIAATVSAMHYHPGTFLNASLDKASEQNERQHITLTMEDGRTLGLVQIAGLVARRILCQVKEGEVMATGQRFGLIRFGSRVDIYLPEGAVPLVIEGQRAVGGETIIADLASAEPVRHGSKI